MSRPIHVITYEEIGKAVPCPHCFKEFASKSTLTRHINRGKCEAIKTQQLTANVTKAVSEELSAKFEKKMADALDQHKIDINLSINQQVSQLGAIIGKKSIPINNNNNLNVMCLGSNDNLLDILTSQVGLPQALHWIKESALGSDEGDRYLLEKVYLPLGKRPTIMYANKSKSKYIYFNENNERVIEGNVTELSRKLANILQRSYLKGMTELPTDICGNLRDGHLSSTPLPIVCAGDMETWNHHIHDLDEEKYQKRVLKIMGIPYERDVPY
jgi:hypothetical protein